MVYCFEVNIVEVIFLLCCVGECELVFNFELVLVVGLIGVSFGCVEFKVIYNIVFEWFYWWKLVKVFCYDKLNVFKW